MAPKRSYPSGTAILLAGTKRGLFLFTSKDRARWKSEGPIFTGGLIYNAGLDQRGGKPRIFAADNHFVYGAQIRYSDDFGRTWIEPRKPIAFPEDSGLSLENVWIVQPGRASEPDTFYAGVDPASLWVSHDRGESWEPNEAILNHPTRSTWMPGLGGMCLHSILPHPTDTQKMWVAASAIGVLGTEDGGASWTFLNKDVPARHIPNEFPEYGQCVHRLHVDPKNPDRLVQQNHWGQFESADGGRNWRDIQSNLPSFFGFPLAIDVHDPQTLFTVPQTQPEAGRHNHGDQFAVWRTNDGGKTWEAMTKGLPKGKHVRLNVLRHAMSADTENPCGVYVGTGTGQIFASPDRGDTWKTVADYMPPVYSVTVSVVA